MIRLRVGICFIEKTRLKLQLPECLENYLQNEMSIEFIVINLDESIEEQGPFDVIIHKILEWFQFGEEMGRKKLMQLLNFTQCNPTVKMMDPIEEVLRVADRFYSYSVLKTCGFKKNGINVFVPKYALIEKQSEIMEEIKRQNISFPIIAKSCDSENHEMSIIFSEKNVKDVTTPCVIQEFVNHSSMLYKVCAIADKTYICERPSVKNLKDGYRDTVHFDSLTVSKREIYHKELHDQNPLSLHYNTSTTEDIQMLDCEVIKEILNRIRLVMNITLFGFDIIIDDNTGDYGIIDLNYMPSYAGLSQNFRKDLSQLLEKIRTDRYTAEVVRTV